MLWVLTQHSYKCLPHHETTDCCFIIQATSSWCICRDISSTASTPGSRRRSASPSSSLVTHKFRFKIKTKKKPSKLNPIWKPFCGFLPRRREGDEVNLGLLCEPANVSVLHAEDPSAGRLLDLAAGRIHRVKLSPAFLLQILQSDARPGWEWFRTVCDSFIASSGSVFKG